MSYVAAVCGKGEQVNSVKEQLLQSNPVLEGENSSTVPPPCPVPCTPLYCPVPPPCHPQSHSAPGPLPRSSKTTVPIQPEKSEVAR